MGQKPDIKLKKMLSFGIVSYLLAILVYFILYTIMPGNKVFLLNFSLKQDLFLIAIPCFLYGILATFLSDIFQEKNIPGKIGLTFVVYLIPILISAPVATTIFFWGGLNLDTYIMAFLCGVIGVICSVPYTLIGLILCFFVTWKVSELWYEE